MNPDDSDQLTRSLRSDCKALKSDGIDAHTLSTRLEVNIVE